MHLTLRSLSWTGFLSLCACHLDVGAPPGEGTENADGDGGDGDGDGDAGGGGGGGEPAGQDPNGVAQIYPTAPDKAPSWTLGFDDWEARTRGWEGTVEGSGADIIVTEGGQVRLNVAAEDSDCEGEPDQGQALEQGYMCSPLDWYNLEMTGYIQLVEAAGAEDDRDWTWYLGGGRHTGDGPPDGCTGSAYKGNFHYADGQTRLRKESWHVNYSNREWKDVPGAPDYTQEPDLWVGLKLVRYEFTRDGERGLRLEQWADLGGVRDDGTPSNDWTLINVEEDHPGAPSWGGQATDCGAPADDQILFWGGPFATFRWDDTTSSMRLMSVRAIVPPADVSPP